MKARIRRLWSKNAWGIQICYRNDITMILQWYYNDMQMILQWYYNDMKLVISSTIIYYQLLSFYYHFKHFETYFTILFNIIWVSFVNLYWNDIVLIYCLISEIILHLYVWYLLIVNDAAYGVYVLICVRHPHVSIHVICVRHPQCSLISLHLLQRFSDSVIASGAAACIVTSAAAHNDAYLWHCRKHWCEHSFHCCLFSLLRCRWFHFAPCVKACAAMPLLSSWLTHSFTMVIWMIRKSLKHTASAANSQWET